jgi:threonine dehydrogenase-like Zn-dependent dehydrogenase
MKALICSGEWQPRKGYQPGPEEVKNKTARVGSQAWRYPELAIADVPDPEPGDEDVLIRIRACGICGSDIHCRQKDGEGYLLFSGPLSLPCILGHEYAGEVVDAGSQVKTLKRGDRVAAEGMLWCGLCEPCRRGRPNQCLFLKMVGFTAPGAFAEYIVTHEKYCWKIDRLGEFIPEDRLFDAGALIEPAGCAYNGLFVTGDGFLPGAAVAVFGAGPIGLMAAALSRAAGASRVIAFDYSPERLDLAAKLGADAVFNVRDLSASGTGPGDLLLEETGGAGADVIVEAAGAASETLPGMIAGLGPNGRIVYLGRVDTSARLDFNPLVSGGNRLAGSRGHAGGGIFPSIIRLLAAGRMNPLPMITGKFTLPDILKAMETAASIKEGKIIVTI